VLALGLFTHELDFSQLPPVDLTTRLSDFSTNRYEDCGLGYNPVLDLPRPRHNQNGERNNSDEDAIGKMGSASYGMRGAIVSIRNRRVPI
jgi:hypothetical protein